MQFQFDFLKRRYREASDQQALALEAVGTPDPNDAMHYFGWSRPMRRFLAAADTGLFTRMEKEALSNGETDLPRVEFPAKRLVVNEGAGHFALTTHQSEVIAALRQTAH